MSNYFADNGGHTINIHRQRTEFCLEITPDRRVEIKKIKQKGPLIKKKKHIGYSKCFLIFKNN